MFCCSFENRVSAFRKGFQVFFREHLVVVTDYEQLMLGKFVVSGMNKYRIGKATPARKLRRATTIRNSIRVNPSSNFL